MATFPVFVASCLWYLFFMSDRLQSSIGEWLRDHEETALVFSCSWSRYFSFMYTIFMCFSINFQTSSYGFFVFLFVFPDEIAFSSILGIKKICFRHHSILREKNLSYNVANFKPMHSPTIIHIIWVGWVQVSSQMDWEWLPVVPVHADVWAYCSNVKCIVRGHVCCPLIHNSSFIHSYGEHGIMAHIPWWLSQSKC